MIRGLNLIFYFLLLSLIVACSDDEIKRNSLLGDGGRNNEFIDNSLGYKQNSSQVKLELEDSSGIIFSPLLLSSFESIITTYSGKVYFLASSNVKWSYSFGGDMAVVSPVLDDRHNLYFGLRSGKIVSLDKSGKKRWELDYEIEGKLMLMNNLLLMDSNLVVSDNRGGVSVLDLDGKLINRFEFDDYLYHTFPSMGDNLILPITKNEYGETDSVIFKNINGDVGWKYALENSRIISSPVVANEVIYVPCTYGDNMNNLGIVYKLSKGGELLGKIELSTIPRYLTVGGDSTVFIGAYNIGLGTKSETGLFGFDWQNKLIWKKYINAKIVSPIYVYKELLCFHGDEIGNGMFIFKKSDGNLIKVISLHDKEQISNIPGVYNSNIVFSSTESNSLIYILD